MARTSKKTSGLMTSRKYGQIYYRGWARGKIAASEAFHARPLLSRIYRAALKLSL